MTAIARRRARRTVFAAVASVVLALVAGTMVIVGVSTLSDSKEGEAVGIDDRPREQFPDTPNAVLAVTDDDGTLTSLVVATLLPAGQGGSLVTIPVNADVSAGFGLQRHPVDEVFDADDIDSLIDSVEEMLSIAVQRALIVAPDGLDELLAPIESVQVELPRDLVDSSETPVEGSVAEQVGSPGPQTLDRSEVVAVLTSSDENEQAYDQHETDIAVWSALAGTAPLTTPPEAVPVDDLGRPIVPSTVEELFDRLWQGTVETREIARGALVTADNPTDADVVLLDRRDSNLVFAQISPGLVSTPTTGLNVRVVAGFTSADLEAVPEVDSTSELLRRFIGKMLFVQASVVSADSTPTGAPAVTVVEVADERQLADMEHAASALFGDAEVRLAETVTEGVDIEVTLGLSYLAQDASGGVPADSGVTTATVVPDE